ncbi:MAG: tetratricopeptide repeat protein, partial [Candidatus Omnitrophica bacterium]|nr:tetratricopeptide repeat protein [Candidatus Omnitrophota bacterium]
MMGEKKLSWRHYVILAALTVAAFFPVLRAEFLNWDDQTHLIRNEAVLTFDLGGMFMHVVQDIYIPLTSLSFAVEKAVFGLNPFVFHLDNLLLHIAVACLLMGLFTRLGAVPMAAFFGSALFALHPMHVESVAWVTERKDVLYAVFYVLALRQWWAYLEQRKPYDLGVTLLWACLSLLAKPMAVSLPLVMIFMEWWKAGSVRQVRWKMYVPVGVLTGVIGWMTYLHHTRNPIGDPGVSALIWIWTLAFYAWKFCLPFIFHPLYALPSPVGLFEPVYLAAVIFVGIVSVYIFRVARHHLDRWLLLAAGFFFLSIFFVLRFDSHDTHVVADRFMYLPSAMVCLWLGIKAEALIARHGRWVQAVIVVVMLLLAVRTFTYAGVWQDSVTLWSYVIRHYPQQEIAYNNRAVAYGDMGRYDLAIRDNTQVLTFPSNRALAFYNRAISFKDWAQEKIKDKDPVAADKLFRLAKADLDAAIGIDPYYAKTYNHRGMVRHLLRDEAGALEDLDKAIERDPNYGEAYNNRGNLRSAAGQLDLALNDYRRVVDLGSFVAEAYSNMGIIYARKGFVDLAMQNFDKAIAVNPQHGEAYFNRSVIRRQQGDMRSALTEALKARSLGIAVDEGYLRS